MAHHETLLPALFDALNAPSDRVVEEAVAVQALLLQKMPSTDHSRAYTLRLRPSAAVPLRLVTESHGTAMTLDDYRCFQEVHARRNSPRPTLNLRP